MDTLIRELNPEYYYTNKFNLDSSPERDMSIRQTTKHLNIETPDSKLMNSIQKDDKRTTTHFERIGEEEMPFDVVYQPYETEHVKLEKPDGKNNNMRVAHSLKISKMKNNPLH